MRADNTNINVPTSLMMFPNVLLFSITSVRVNNIINNINKNINFKLNYFSKQDNYFGYIIDKKSKYICECGIMNKFVEL